MMKRYFLTVIAVFVAWQIMDFVIHNLILRGEYEGTLHLWRPMEEMNYPLMLIVSLIGAACFCGIYALFFKEKNLMNGLKYGLIFGLGVGSSMGFGTYAVQTITLYLALGWFLGMLAETAVAGLIAGAILKD